jgi:hypothetical protein
MALPFQRQNSVTVLQPCKPCGLFIRAAKPSHTAGTLDEMGLEIFLKYVQNNN